MSSRVIVRTGARLHFGLLAVNPVDGRRFGGVGVMVDGHGYEIAFEAAHSDEIQAPTPSTAARIRDFLARLRQSGLIIPPLRVSVHREIASHAGLGSGTQLGLAVAAGVQMLLTGRRDNSQDLAARVARGRRSGIGVHGFDAGGLLVEAGRSTDEELSPLITRVAVPEAWRWVLVTPQASPGLSGPAEKQAFEQLRAMPRATTAELCRLLLMEWLPGLQQANFDAVSESLWAYGQHVGEFFRGVQHGVFANPQMETLAGQLRQRKLRGIAQTSWGPTIAVLCRDDGQAATAVEWIREIVADPTVTITICRTRHCGAEVTIER